MIWLNLAIVALSTGREDILIHITRHVQDGPTIVELARFTLTEA